MFTQPSIHIKIEFGKSENWKSQIERTQKPFVLIIRRGKKYGKLERELASELVSIGIAFERMLLQARIVR